jgi:hypothetical protein
MDRHVTSADSFRRETTLPDEGLPGRDHDRVTHRQDPDRRPSDGRQADEHRPPPGEMLAPPVLPRVVKARQLPGHRVESGEVGSLVAVARAQAKARFEGSSPPSCCSAVM